MTHTSRARTTAAALVLALVTGLTALTSVGASAAEASYQQKDRAGDVSFGHGKGITKAQRRSIDVRLVRVVPDGTARTVPMSVTLRDVTRTKKFVQAVTMLFSTPDGTAVGSVAFSPTRGERSRGRAVNDAGNDIESCGGLRTRVARDSVVSVTVPYRCVPGVRVEVSTTTTTKRYRSSGGYYSLDSARSDRAHRLRPTPDEGTTT